MPRPCHGLPPPDTVPLCPRVAQIDQQKGLLGYELDDMTAKPDFYLMELLHQVVAHSWWPRVLAPSACPAHTHAAAVPVYAVACVCVRMRCSDYAVATLCADAAAASLCAPPLATPPTDAAAAGRRAWRAASQAAYENDTVGRPQVCSEEDASRMTAGTVVLRARPLSPAPVLAPCEARRRWACRGACQALSQLHSTVLPGRTKGSVGVRTSTSKLTWRVVAPFSLAAKLHTFRDQFTTPSGLVISGAGIPHDEFVGSAEKHFGSKMGEHAGKPEHPAKKIQAKVSNAAQPCLFARCCNHVWRKIHTPARTQLRAVLTFTFSLQYVGGSMLDNMPESPADNALGIPLSQIALGFQVRALSTFFFCAKLGVGTTRFIGVCCDAV